MRNAIWKYKLIPEQPVLFMPPGAKILKMAMIDGYAYLWAFVDTTQHDDYGTEFMIYGTGQTIEEPVENYVGTYFEGPYVWHIFKKVA